MKFHDLIATETLRNRGTLTPAQRAAIFAKRAGGVTAVGNITRRPPPAPAPTDSPRYIPPGQPGGRPWGESNPGEMYPAIEGPGNPAWERRHPERNPIAGNAPGTRPAPTAPAQKPQQSNGLNKGQREEARPSQHVAPIPGLTAAEASAVYARRAAAAIAAGRGPAPKPALTLPIPTRPTPPTTPPANPPTIGPAPPPPPWLKPPRQSKAIADYMRGR